MNKKIMLLVVATLVTLSFILFFPREKGEYVEITYSNTLEDGMLEEEVPKVVLIDGWITDTANVWEAPTVKSAKIGEIQFNTNVQYFMCDKEWACIEYPNGRQEFIESKYIQDNKIESSIISAPSNRGFKSYMPYKAITQTSSPQYVLQSSFGYTGKYGIRMVAGRYCIALGTGFKSPVGTYVDLILNSGIEIPCIVGDIKSDADTLSNNMTTAHNGCVVEFIVDIDCLNSNAKRDGDMSSCCEEWNSPLKDIRVYEKNIF